MGYRYEDSIDRRLSKFVKNMVVLPVNVSFVYLDG